MNPKALAVLLLLATATNASSGAPMPVSIVPGSLEVTVDVKPNVDAFTAKVSGGELTATADPETHEISSAVYTFDWSGVKTGKDKRDREMLDWADSKKFPKGTFTLKSVETSGDSHVAKGTLDIHGVSKDIEFPVTIAFESGVYKVSGSAKFDHREWGLKQIRKFLVLSVDPTVTVNFKFQAAGAP